MKAQELFLIILKVFGIYLLKDVLFSVPPVVDNVIRLLGDSVDIAYFTMIVSLLALGLQVAIVYLLLFKTHDIIDKLKLTSGLREDTLVLNLHRSSVYSIAVIVSGIVILVFAIPNLLRQVYYWIQYIESKNHFYAGPPFDYASLLTAIFEVITGYLFISQKQAIVNFVEMKRRTKKDTRIVD
jgi:hypothetical protein